MESVKIIALKLQNSMAIIDNGIAEGDNVAIGSMIITAYLLIQP